MSQSLDELAVTRIGTEATAVSLADIPPAKTDDWLNPNLRLSPSADRDYC
jgi:hypothetical protein